MATLQEEGAQADYLIGSQTAETRVSNLRASLHTLLTHLMLLLSLGLFARRQWGPALIVLAVYVVTLVVNASDGVFSENDDR